MSDVDINGPTDNCFVTVTITSLVTGTEMIIMKCDALLLCRGYM